MNKKNDDLISVIIPCFNSGETIERAVNSIHMQTWINREIIIVNDGSNDEKTISTLNNIRNVRIFNQKNEGLSSARNKGAENSLGTFLLFLDADDWLEPNALELMYYKLINSRTNSYVYSDMKLEGESNNLIKKDYNFFEQLFLNQIPYCILIDKNIWVRVGGYDESMKLGYEDWEFNIRLGSKGFYGKRVEKTLFHYSVSKSGMLISKSSKYHAKIWNFIKAKHINLYKPYNLINLWLIWKSKKSTYPLFFFFGWFIILKIFPDNFVSYIFIKLRNFKWFFVREKFLSKKD